MAGKDFWKLLKASLDFPQRRQTPAAAAGLLRVKNALHSQGLRSVQQRDRDHPAASQRLAANNDGCQKFNKGQDHVAAHARQTLRSPDSGAPPTPRRTAPHRTPCPLGSRGSVWKSRLLSVAKRKKVSQGKTTASLFFFFSVLQSLPLSLGHVRVLLLQYFPTYSVFVSLSIGSDFLYGKGFQYYNHGIFPTLYNLNLYISASIVLKRR